MVEPAVNRHTHVLKELGKFIDPEKYQGKLVKLTLSHVAAKAARMLFKKLLTYLE